VSADAGTEPLDVPVLHGFSQADEVSTFVRRYALALSGDDLRVCQTFFAARGREPTLAELRVLDTYWSDHCRHTTFNTELLDINAEDASPALQQALACYERARQEVYGAAAPPPSLMDMATIGAKCLKKQRKGESLNRVDVSDEINACTVLIDADFADGSREPWLLLFKNETHNHPTEIEPFGGAATCLGGAIRDPLSGRCFVYQAMRVSGAGDPRAAVSDTIPGKLPQVKIVREAAAGYSSYGNQIGLATGQVAEFYHPGFTAKHLELGAVIGAVPRDWVRREKPEPGDVVLLVGGRTGRDGIGGATGSSKAHTGESVQQSGAEVQKGNAVEERKLQRLFRNPAVTCLIKRCNDFGAGGVAVAVGELAAGLDITLDAIPRKYESLDGIELSISESQERMAVVTSRADADVFIKAAAGENLDATIIAVVTDKERLCMYWRGDCIVDLPRSFLDANGARRSARVRLPARKAFYAEEREGARRSARVRLPARKTFYAEENGALRRTRVRLPARKTFYAEEREEKSDLLKELSSLRSASRRGLQERFDGSVGAGSVLFPFGGATQGTPECGMAALLPSLEKESCTASIMTFGFDPVTMERDPYEGAKGAIREALAKFACLGGDPWMAYLSLQEYFPKPDTPELWGLPAAALLGALEAQLALCVPAIGGKDSMSGTYRDDIALHVPPTLIAFAAGVAPAAGIRSGALSGKAGNPVILLYHNDNWDSFKANLTILASLYKNGAAQAAYPVCSGGVAATLAIMALGNMTGLHSNEVPVLTSYQGAVLVEIDGAAYPDVQSLLTGGTYALAAWTTAEPVFCTGTETFPLALLRQAYESTLKTVYPCELMPAKAPEFQLPAPLPATFVEKPLRSSLSARHVHTAAPLVVLPIFPGTNGEWDTERVFRRSGARTQMIVFRNRNRTDIADSIQELSQAIRHAQIIALSGGFSAGDEPDGSGKFISAVLQSPALVDAVYDLLEQRDGLVLGICNGFQALIKLGLVPYGRIQPAQADSPTLSFNTIGRHISQMVRTQVVSTISPWLACEEMGTIHTVPISHGEGRLVINPAEAERLFASGQVPFCYIDNPNGSSYAIEGLTSPDGRVLGKMGHSERCGELIHRNIPGNKHQRIFEAGVYYFT
jgi:phosphoribosylformylglycinamidine synthase